MASNIEYETIDENYPVSGQDNNSQGFRDNFNIIKNSFADAQSEITDLQDNAARTDQDSDFANNSIVNANLVNATETYANNGSLTAVADVVLDNGAYQKFSVAASTTLTLSSWPNENYSRVIVELVSANTSGPYVITFIGEGSNQAMKREAGSIWAGTSTVTSLDVEISSTSASRLFEFWTYDNGTTIFAKYLGEFE